MTQVGETEVVGGNVRDIVNRLSRDMTNRNPFSVHQVERRAPISSNTPTSLFVVTYQYTATQTDELSLAVGDIIELISEVEDGWSKGRVKSTGAVGMFPTNFVTAKPVTTTASAGIASTSTSRPKNTINEVVMRSEPKAIERTPSTIISEQTPIVKAIEVKPTAFVTSSAASASTETPETTKTKEMARVKFVYNPQHDDELALADLDILINITNKNCGDAGWFEGELHGKKGLFPDNFVELVQVPLSAHSGQKYSSISRQTPVTLVGNKPPPLNPPQPAVPPKPAKILSTDSSTEAPSLPQSSSTSGPTIMPSVSSTTSTPPKNNFEALRGKISSNLKVVAPENVASVKLKPAEQRDRTSSIEVSGAGDHTTDIGTTDQVTELQHITKNRARPPKSRPMSMVMSRNRSSEESPKGRLSSPTSTSSTNSMSTSMFVAASAKEISIPSNTVHFKTNVPSTVVPPSSSTKPALRPVPSNSLGEHSDSPVKKISSPDSQKSSDNQVFPSSDYVSRGEYDALLERFRALESRVVALEKHRF